MATRSSRWWQPIANAWRLGWHARETAQGLRAAREAIEASNALLAEATVQLKAWQTHARELQARAEAIDAHVTFVLDHAAFVRLENLDPERDMHNYVRLTMVDPVGGDWQCEGTLASVITAAYNELPLEG